MTTTIHAKPVMHQTLPATHLFLSKSFITGTAPLGLTSNSLGSLQLHQHAFMAAHSDDICLAFMLTPIILCINRSDGER